MYQLNEGKMEQIVVGVVAVVIVIGATVLGLQKDKDMDTTTVLTGVATGLFGYAGMAGKRDNKEEQKKEESQDE